MRYVFALMLALAVPACVPVTAAVTSRPKSHSFCWFEVTKLLPGMKSPPSGVYETDCGILAVWL